MGRGGGPCGYSKTTEINRAEKKLWEEEGTAQGEGVLLLIWSWEMGAGGGSSSLSGWGPCAGLLWGSRGSLSCS